MNYNQIKLMGELTMTKKQAIKLFNEVFGDSFGDDIVAKRTAWNDFTDSLMKDGEITETQYDTWTQPF